MIIKLMQISRIMTAIQLNQNKFNISTSVTQVPTTIEAAAFLNQLIINHSDRCYRVRDYYKYTGTTPTLGMIYPADFTNDDKKAFNDFYFLWINFWNDERCYNYLKTLAALHSNYNPLHNYDKQSDIIRGKAAAEYEDETVQDGAITDERTVTGKEKTERSETGTKTNEREFNNGETDTGKVTTYDDPSFRNDTQHDIDYDGTITDTESFTNRKTTETKEYTDGFKDKTVKDYDNLTTTVTRSYTENPKTINDDTFGTTDYEHSYESTTGNIGVTSSQDMLNQEINVRMYSIVNDYVRMFVSEYLFYV